MFLLLLLRAPLQEYVMPLPFTTLLLVMPLAFVVAMG